jgi:Tol biopolymer transport system component
MVRDLATAVDTKITSMPQGARQPSWSSDGQMIVFTTDEATYSADEAGSIYVVQSREGATPTLVLAGGSPGTGTQWEYPSFAPGDASIVANTDVLVEAFLDGRPRRTIVSWNGQPSEATLSPDGRRVIVGGGCAPVGRQLSMVRFDGAMGDMCANGTLLTNLGFAVRHPAWGPQGLVAFDGGNGTADVYLLVLGDGTTAPIICRITKAYSMNRNATWFPTK